MTAVEPPAASLPPQVVLMTGASGLIGTALRDRLLSDGHRVRRLLRAGVPAPEDLRWNPAEGLADPSPLEGVTAVVNLAGESIAAGRLGAAHRRRVRESRVITTRRLCETLARMKHPPGVLVSTSGINYYGNRGNELLTEDSSLGETFLADLCRQWEDATAPALDAGIRVVLLRTAVVLTASAGVLPRMLPLFRFGLGGRLGSGGQFMPCIGMDDHLRAILFCIARDSITGPVNSTGPEPVSNREFTCILNRVLRRPGGPPVPEIVLRLVLGSAADELLLCSTRAVPARLREEGFVFLHPTVEEMLRRALGRAEED